MKLKIVLEPLENGGYTAHSPSLPGYFSRGGTIEETMAGFREATQPGLTSLEGGASEDIGRICTNDIDIVWRDVRQ